MNSDLREATTPLTQGGTLKYGKKSLVTAATLATIGGMGTLGVHAVSAQNNSGSDPRSNLVDKIASTFNVNKADVQKVFDENHSEMEAKRKAGTSDRLQKLVDAGTITAEQKTAIEAKLMELHANHEATRDSMKDLSKDERKAKMQQQRTELENWAKENNLDLSKLRGIFMGGPEGHGRRGGPLQNDN